MNPKKTLQKLKGESDKGQVTLYLNKPSFEEFKKLCGDIAASRVLDELIHDFISASSTERESVSDMSLSPEEQNLILLCRQAGGDIIERLLLIAKNDPAFSKRRLARKA